MGKHKNFENIDVKWLIIVGPFQNNVCACTFLRNLHFKVVKQNWRHFQNKNQINIIFSSILWSLKKFSSIFLHIFELRSWAHDFWWVDQKSHPEIFKTQQTQEFIFKLANDEISGWSPEKWTSLRSFCKREKVTKFYKDRTIKGPLETVTLCLKQNRKLM